MTCQNRPKKTFRRRQILAAGLGAAIAAPALVRAATSSGEVNVMGWAGFPDYTAVFEKFTRQTGIKVNFIPQPDQTTMLVQARRALYGGGVDMVEPTIDLVGAYEEGGLLRPWDLSKIPLDNYEPAFITGLVGSMAEIRGHRYHIPTVWGTEALVYARGSQAVEYGRSGLSDLWEPGNVGRVTVRAHSGLSALGRVMEEKGQLPKPFRDSFVDPDTMKVVWDIVLAEALKHKDNIVQFWKSEHEAQAAFRVNGSTLGLCWDSTGYNLSRDGTYGFIAPKEGAFAWLQGMVMMKNAWNIDQAHALAAFFATPEGSAAQAKNFSANPTVKGAIELADDAVLQFYKAAYPGDALDRLWWWPAQPDWFLDLRNEYARRFQVG